MWSFVFYWFHVKRQRPGWRLLTKAQSRSTASSTSSWCPTRDTPRDSSSWWDILSSFSPSTCCSWNDGMYCCRQSSRPEGQTRGGATNTPFIKRETSLNLMLRHKRLPLTPFSCLCSDPQKFDSTWPSRWHICWVNTHLLTLPARWRRAAHTIP